MSQPPSSDQPASSVPVVSGEQPSLRALREAVLQAATALLGRGRGGKRRRRWPAGAGGHHAWRRPAARGTSATTRPTPRCCWRRAWAPRRAKVAERLGAQAREATLGAPALQRFEVARAGLSQPVRRRRLVCAASLGAVLAAGRGLRPPAPARAASGVMVEFVSANPTGPMHVGQRAQTPPTGDALAAPAGIHRRGASRARVLRQRRRLAGAQLRRVDPGASPRGGARAGERLSGRLHCRARAADRRCRDRRSGRGRSGGRGP